MKFEFKPGTKINIVSIYFPPETGAAASRIFKMATSLQERGADVEVITALPNYPKGKIFKAYQGSISVTEDVNGIATRRYWLYPSNSGKAFLRILNMLSFSLSMFLSLPHLWRRKPNIIIINSPPLLVGFSAVIMAKFLRAEAVVNVSDIWPLSALELGAISRGRFYSLLEWVEGFIYCYADKLLTQSEETWQHILERRKGAQVLVYRNLDKISSHIDQIPAKNQGRVKVVYAGLLGVAQGVFDICQMIDFATINVELHIYGDGNEREKIETYVTSNPKCNIHLHSMVPKEQVPEVLSQFHATLIPLKSPIYGAFPSKIYMAISSGLPVLFCGEGEGVKCVEKYGLGWIGPSGDGVALTANLKALSAMTEEQYIALRKHIAKLARSEFDIDDQADRMSAFVAGR